MTLLKAAVSGLVGATIHAQENLEILRNHINKAIESPNEKFKLSAWHLGTGRFENDERVFAYDFQKKASPTATDSLNQLARFQKRSENPKMQRGARYRRTELNSIKSRY